MHCHPSIALLSLLAMAACGPAVNAGDGDDTTTGDASSTSSTSSTSPTTSGTTTPGTTTTSSSTTGVDPDGSGSSSGCEPNECGNECGWIECPSSDDDGGIECDAWEQDCAELEKCMPWANDGGKRWTSTRCSPLADPPHVLGEPCMVEGSAVSGIDDCALGMMCLWVDPLTNLGTCVANCGGTENDPSCDEPGTTCVIDFEGVLHVCLPLCDPLLQDCAHGGCYPYGMPSEGFACGAPLPPLAADFEACGHDWDCQPGSLCPDADQPQACEDGDCCSPICDLTVPDACADDRVCTPVSPRGKFPPDLEDVGYCALP
jgi:hypothetical protein